MNKGAFNNRSSPVDHVKIMSRDELWLLLGVLPPTHYLRALVEQRLRKTGKAGKKQNREAA